MTEVYLQDPDLTLYRGDALDVLRAFEPESVQCVVSSPPYWALRNYGVEGQLGLEPTVNRYIENIVAVFRELRRVLRNDGTLWLNLGDCHYNGDKGGASKERIGSASPLQRTNHGANINNAQNRTPQLGLKPKDLVGLPWRVAFALQADGWYLRSDIIWCLSGGTRLYARTQKGDGPVMLKDLVRLDPATVHLWNGEKWTQVRGWSKSPEPQDGALEIELRSGERIGCTAGHMWPTQRGNIRADELTIGDVIASTHLPEPENPDTPSYLPDEEIGWLCGRYLADGSGSEDTVQIACHADEADALADRARMVAVALHGSATAHQTGAAKATVNLNGPLILATMRAYIYGSTARRKGLTARVWRRSNRFLRALIDGYLSGDGHYDEKIDRWRLGFTRNDRLAADMRTLAARIGATLTLRATYSKGFGSRWPSYRGEMRFTRSGHHNERPRSEVVVIRRSRARQFWDVGVADEPHIFALASGVLTRNSKPNPMPESVTDRPTRSHEYMFLLTKSKRYYYDAEAIKEPAKAADLHDYTGPPRRSQPGESGTRYKMPAGWDSEPGSRDSYHRNGRHKGDERLDPITFEKHQSIGANKRTVWTIPTQGYPGTHFACVDEQTECMTTDGWKGHDELRTGDLAAQFDMDECTLSWGRVESVRSYHVRNQEMVVGRRRDLDLILTPNHRCVIQRRHPRTRQLQAPCIIRADEMKPSHAVPTAAPWSQVGDASLPLEWAELLGWYIAEGYEAKRSLAVELYQSVTANPHKVRRIEELLRQVGAEWTAARATRSWRGREGVQVAYRLTGYAAARLRELALGKRIPVGALRWREDRIEALLRGLIGGDGHVRSDGRAVFIQKDVVQAGLVQALAIRLGLAASLTRRSDGICTVYLTKHRTRSFRGTAGAGKPMDRARYTGVVWCPKLPHGTWLARRNGKCFITGNTFPQALVVPCIKAGTSEWGQCAECGAPWRRVITVDYDNPGNRTTNGNRSKSRRHETAGFDKRLERRVQTNGWEASCNCDTKEVLPQVVLDTFIGSGTTALVARKLGRRAIGVDINKDYLDLAAKRLQQQSLLTEAYIE